MIHRPTRKRKGSRTKYRCVYRSASGRRHHARGSAASRPAWTARRMRYNTITIPYYDCASHTVLYTCNESYPPIGYLKIARVATAQRTADRMARMPTMPSPDHTARSTLRLATAADGTPSTALSQAADILRAGGLVAFPTETVYGLGADATNPQAVYSIFV